MSFSDIKPAAKCHYLIVSRNHIRDAKSLTKDQKPLGNCFYLYTSDEYPMYNDGSIILFPCRVSGEYPL